MFKIVRKNIYDEPIDPIEADDTIECSLEEKMYEFDPEEDMVISDEEEDITVTEYGVLGDIDFEEMEEIDDISMLDIEKELETIMNEDINEGLLKEMKIVEKEIIEIEKPEKAPAKKKRAVVRDTIVIDSIRKYQKDVSRYELLTKEEEVDLARKWRDKQDQAAFHRLIVSNLRLVISIAQKYRNNGLDFNELIQEGNIGLIRALERYDPEAGFRISTYATWWIRQCIVRGLADKSRHIRLPVHVNEKVIKIEKVKNLLYKKFYRVPTAEEIASFLPTMTLSEIKGVIDAVKDVSSININVGDDGNSTIADFIEDKAVLDPAIEISKNNLKNTLYELIGELPERERYIIERRFNLDGSKNQTLEEIGAVLGVTRERVRQLEVKGLKMLKELMDSRDINRSDFC